MNDPDVLFPWEKEGGDPQAGAERADAGDAGDTHAGEGHAGVESGRDVAGSDEAGQDAGQGAATSEARAAPHAEATPAATERDEADPGDDAGAATSLAWNDVDDAGAVDAMDVTGDADTAQATADAGNATASADAPADAAGAVAKADHAVADDAAADDTADDESRFEVLDTEYARQAAERARAALREKPVAQKEYYAISEVCELVGLKPHVLRYWETQFQVLNPSKNRSGNRVYQRKEIRLISLVKHLLYEEKYTVEGAKAKLDRLRRSGELTGAAGTVLDRAMIDQLRADLTELTTLLTPPART